MQRNGRPLQLKVGRINRGDIWIVNLNPALGREVHKKRPALIISNNDLNQNTFHVIVIPSSTIIPEVVSEELVFVSGISGFAKDSVLLPLFIRSIDKIRLIKRVGKLPDHKMEEIEAALDLVLGITKI